jgi:GTP:adenosylcobinamide-phosphate guanylyltransferase
MSRQAVILAGGLGTRLKPFTEVIPKPLLPVGEKAVLEIQIEHLKKYQFEEIFLATNYMANYIENFFGDGSRYGVRLTVSREEQPLGTAGPLKLLQSKLTEPFLVMNGDILSLMDFSKFFDFARAKQTVLTVAVKKIVTPYAFGNICFEGDLVTRIGRSRISSLTRWQVCTSCRRRSFRSFPRASTSGWTSSFRPCSTGACPLPSTRCRSTGSTSGRSRTTGRRGTCTNVISRANDLTGSTVYVCELKP